MDDTVSIYIEGYLDLRNSSGSGSDSVKTEHTELLVVLCELSFALEYVYINRGLVVCCGGEYLGLLSGDGGISFDDLCAYAAHGLKSE